MIFAAIGDSDAHDAALREATRPNGTVNVSEFVRLADAALLEYRIATHPEADNRA